MPSSPTKNFKIPIPFTVQIKWPWNKHTKVGQLQYEGNLYNPDEVIFPMSD